MKVYPLSSRRCVALSIIAAFTLVRVLYAVPSEVVAREEGLRTIDTVELFRNGIYWWTPSSCSGDVINFGGASYIAFTDPRFTAPNFSLFGAPPGVAGGFQRGDALDLGISITHSASGLKGVLLPDCSYGAYFVRDDEAFYYAQNRVLVRKPFTSPAVDPGEQLRFRVALERLPIRADGALFVTENEIWSYAADLSRNTLTIQRSWKPETRDQSAPREVLSIPGVSVRKFAIVDIQATDGSYLGSELIILTPDGSIYRGGVNLGSAAQLIRRGVSDFAIRNETYDVLGNLGVTSKRRATTLYMALGNTLTLTGESQLLGLDLNPGARGQFVELPGVAGFRFTSVAVDKNRIFVTRTPASGQPNSDLLRRDAPAEPTLLNPGETSYATIGQAREFRSLRTTGRGIYFTHANTVQRLPLDAPEIDLDFESFGIEVTQAIQNLNNAMPLVAAKRVFVRGYARLNASSSGPRAYDVPAQLRVYHQPKVPIGQAPFTEIMNSPFLPVLAPRVTNIAALDIARTNANTTYLFELSEDLIVPGNLRFEFILNPDRAVPETGINPLANNTSAATLECKETLVIPLTMLPVMYGGGIYDYRTDPNFWNMISRAQSILPVPGFRLGFRSSGVARTVITITGLKARSFDLPAQDDDALAAVDLARVLDGNPLGGPYVGMFPQGVPNWNGLGRRPGQAQIIRMASTPYSWLPWNSLHGGLNLAHEFGHNSGFKHVLNSATCGNVPGSSDGTYDALPNGASGCTMGAIDVTDPATYVGFDPLSKGIPLPGNNGDLMSYANSVWISDFNWRRMYDAFSFRFDSVPHLISLAVNEAPAGEYLLIQGTLNRENNTAELLPVYTMAGAEIPAASFAELTQLPPDLPANYPVRLQLIGANDAVIEDQPAPLGLLSEGPQALISRALPMRAGAVALRLVNAGTTVLDIPISPRAPAVAVNHPQVTDGRLKISWDATDADGDLLSYTTQLSVDDGATWQVLQVNRPEPALDLDTQLLPGGATARVRVLATDGVRSTSVTSGQFSLPKHPPAAKIAGVMNGDQFDFGASITATGFGYDAEDGTLVASALVWKLEGPEPRQGTGSSFSLSNLAPGAYDLSLAVTDSDGESATESIRFIVRQFAIANGAEPILDGLNGDPGYGTSPSVRLPLSNGNYATVRFVHASGALFVCLSGLKYGAAGGSGATAGLRIDPAQAGQPVTLAAGFAVNEFGEPLRVQGDGTKFVPITTAPPGFRVVILRDETSWAAEMRVADDLLGGWSDFLGMVLFADDGAAATAPNTWPPSASIDNPGTWMTSSAGPLPPLAEDGNLLPYGDAEGLEGRDGSALVSIPGWILDGTFTVTRWDAGGGFPIVDDPGPVERGANFFSGGPSAGVSTATTVIDLPVNPERIDAGLVAADFSGWLGGYAEQADNARLIATFLDAGGDTVDTWVLGPVMPTDRENKTGLVMLSTNAIVSPQARKARVVLEMRRESPGAFNDGYADNLRFTLRDTTLNPASNLPPVADPGAPFSRVVQGGETIQLDGSGSVDPEGAPLSFVWRQLDGPGLTFADGASAKPSFTSPAVTAPLTLSFELLVNDGDRDSVPAITQITLSPPGFGVLIFNGSFEDVTNSFVRGNNSVMSLPVGSEVIPGWTTLQAELAWGSNSNIFGLATPVGEFLLDLTGFHDSPPYGGVQQTIQTRPDTIYRLSFDVGSQQETFAYRGPMTVAAIAGTSSNTFTFTPPTAATGSVWMMFETEFVAASAATQLTIAGSVARGGHYLGLDNVSLTTSTGEELLENGSFEDASGDFVPDGNGVQTLQPDSTAIPGWTTTGAELAWVSNTNAYQTKTLFGNLFLDLTGYHDSPPYGAVVRDIPTTEGETYKLSFGLGVNQDDTRFRGPITVAVTFGSEIREFTLLPTGAGNQWHTFTMDFRASGTSTPITLLGLASAGGGYLGLDNVSVSAVGSASQIELAIARGQAGTIVLRFSSESGPAYVVETAANLETPVWSELQGTLLQGTGGEITIPIAIQANEARRFFRLRQR